MESKRERAGRISEEQAKKFGNRQNQKKRLQSSGRVTLPEVQEDWIQDIKQLKEQISLIRKGLIGKNPVVRVGFESLFERYKNDLEDDLGRAISLQEFIQSTYNLFFESCTKYESEKITPIFQSKRKGKHYKRKNGFLNPQEMRYLIARDYLDGVDVDKDKFAMKEGISSFDTLEKGTNSYFVNTVIKRLRKR